MEDWPITGPRTTKWVCEHIHEHSRTPLNHHQQWRSLCRLQPHDGGVSEHEQCCRTLQTMACYDMYNLYNSASAEIIARRLQLCEERYKDRLLAGAGEDETGERHLFGGSTGTRGNLCVAPSLQKYIAEEMARDSAILKERRKAREERSLARPKGKAKAKGEPGGD